MIKIDSRKISRVPHKASQTKPGHVKFQIIISATPASKAELNTMGKSGKKKKNQTRVADADSAAFVERAQELKDEGNACFQAADFNGAMELYNKALKILPEGHADAVFLHTNMALCLMRRADGAEDYERAVSECTAALQLNPRYKKALLRRAGACEALGHLDAALADLEVVLRTNPNDKHALEAAARLHQTLGHGNVSDTTQDKEALIIEELGTASAAALRRSRKLKLVCNNDDIRLAEMAPDSSLADVRNIVRQRFPACGAAVLIKYRDAEGDLVTITSTEELRLAEESCCIDASDFLRLYVVEVDPKHDPFFDSSAFDAKEHDEEEKEKSEQKETSTVGSRAASDVDVDRWVQEFMELFKSHLGIDPEGHINLQEVGMEFCVKALEDTATSDDAQPLFEMAESKFQEIAALALFNLGNVHMCAATKRIPLHQTCSKDDLLSLLQKAYAWAQQEYDNAGRRYEEALWIKPDFYEGLLALGQQLFESAKLSWSLAVATNADLESWDPSETLEYFHSAEEKIKIGIQMWEKLEQERLRELARPYRGGKNRKESSSYDSDDEHGIQTITEVVENAAVMRSQINLFWGNVLFERSHIEFKLGIASWKEHLDAAVERFKIAGASATDVAVVVKNHPSNAGSREGLEYNIDEIVQAWNEMCEAKRFVKKCSSFRLEPLFRRKVPRLHQILEHMQIACH